MGVVDRIFSIKKSGNNVVLNLLGFKYVHVIGGKKSGSRYSIRHIDKKQEQNNYLKFLSDDSFGLNTVEDRQQKIIVSLTSFPERMYDIHFTIYSLLKQTLKPDKILLWLAEEQFPNKEKDIPKSVLELTKKGLTIEWCKDIRSYKKLIPSLELYPNDIIITTDDDIFYAENVVEMLYNAYLKNPNLIHCHRGHVLSKGKNGEILPYEQWMRNTTGVKPSFCNFFTGAGGVLYPPNCLTKEVFNETAFTQIAPNADDIWFWAMALMNGVMVNIIPDNIRFLTYVNPERELGLNGEMTLYHSNGLKGKNDLQLKKMLDKYPQILVVLMQESNKESVATGQ